MPIADRKKVRSAITRIGWAIIKARAAVDDMETVQVLYVAANPDPVGTALEGNEAAVATRIAALRAEVDRPFWDILIAAIDPSHRGEAL